jgi:shikimate dehydrogenase
MIKIGLLGKSLGYSISPILHATAFNEFDIQHQYKIWDIEESEIPSFIQEIKDTEVKGFNITIPYKEAILPFMDEIDHVAMSIGAVNTVHNINGKLFGYNTDIFGIKKTFEIVNSNLNNKRVIIIGAGGAAKSIIYYLNSQNIQYLDIFNRTKNRAYNLAIDFHDQDTVSCHGFNDIDVIKIIEKGDVIINATPYGTDGSQLAKQLPPINSDLPWVQCVSKKHLLFDLVYNPAMTPFLDVAKSAGAKYIGGLNMLVFQAAKSFEVWNEKQANEQKMFLAATDALK